MAVRGKPELESLARDIKKYCDEVLHCGCTKEEMLQALDEHLANHRRGYFRDKFPNVPSELAIMKEAVMEGCLEAKTKKVTTAGVASATKKRGRKPKNVS